MQIFIVLPITSSVHLMSLSHLLCAGDLPLLSVLSCTRLHVCASPAFPQILRDTESEAYHPRREPVPAAAQRPRPPDCEVSEANSRNSSLGSHATRKTPVSSIHWCYISESAPPRSVPDIRPAPPAHLPFYSAHYRLSKISP